jgi:hypothetical protein
MVRTGGADRRLWPAALSGGHGAGEIPSWESEERAARTARRRKDSAHAVATRIVVHVDILVGADVA